MIWNLPVIVGLFGKIWNFIPGVFKRKTPKKRRRMSAKALAWRNVIMLLLFLLGMAALGYLVWDAAVHPDMKVYVTKPVKTVTQTVYQPGPTVIENNTVSVTETVTNTLTEISTVTSTATRTVTDTEYVDVTIAGPTLTIPGPVTTVPGPTTIVPGPTVTTTTTLPPITVTVTVTIELPDNPPPPWAPAKGHQ